MKAVKELGITKSIKFIIYQSIGILYRFMFLPPMRKFLLTILGAKIGNNSVLMNVKFFNEHQSGFRGLKIANDCFIGDETIIDLYGEVILEDKVTIAQRVTILTHINVGYSDHPLQKIFPKKSAPVVFKKGSVAAASSTILAGITIGENSMIAAGSVVNDNVSPNTLVAGVPAKFVRKV